MSLPFRRRTERGSSPHERARIAAARRMDEPLDADEAVWLDRHLAECAACQAIADAYLAQRLELQQMRDTPPVPPRDLWARTAAAIEASAGPPGRAAGKTRRAPLLHRLRPSPVPLGAISGVLVVVVVVGASLLSSRPLQSVVPPAGTQAAVTSLPSQSDEPRSTPIAVTADVSWAVAGDGKLEIFSSRVDEVCATTEAPDCAPIEGGEAATVTLPETELDSVILSPEESELVLFEAATSEAGGNVLVVPAPTPPGQTPPPPTPTPSIPTTEPPTPSVTPTDSPTGSIDPSNPTSPTPSATPTGSIDPNAPLAIATDVIIVGEAASYAPDGPWFAFSARPADGSQGPDIYVWQPGWPSAVPVTHDHQSIFSSWVDGRILASRAVIESDGATPSPDPGASATPSVEVTPSSSPSLAPGETPLPTIPPTARPQAFLLDPATGQETILEGIDAWLPSVDPTRRLVVFWDGTLQLDEATREWQPAEGALVLARWPEVPEPPALPSGSPPVDASGQPIDPTATPSATPTPSPSLLSPPIDGSGSPTPPQLEEPIAVLAAGPLANWDARWDETGTHLAVWIEDALDRSIGRLTLHVIDAELGELVEDADPITGRLALSGFAIGNGRLVWATPGGEDGEGTKVAVVAWTDDSIGSVETRGGNEQVVIVR